MKRIGLLTSLLVCSSLFLCGQGNITDTLRHPSLRIKGTLFDMSYFSLPYAGAGVEFDLSKDWTLDIGAGYIYKSVDENINANGFRLHSKFNQTLDQRRNNRGAISVGVYYTHAFLNGYLLHQKTMRGSTYNEYLKRNYSKQRYGVTLEWINQFRIPDTQWFFEIGIGAMLSRFKTITPSDVTQQDFRNGLFYGKKIAVPSPIFKVKMGYMLWNEKSLKEAI